MLFKKAYMKGYGSPVKMCSHRRFTNGTSGSLRTENPAILSFLYKQLSPYVPFPFLIVVTVTYHRNVERYNATKFLILLDSGNNSNQVE